MWHLDNPSSDTLASYKESILPGLTDRIMNSSLTDEEKQILLIRHLDGMNIPPSEALLVSNPEVIFMINEQLMPYFIQGYSLNELQEYAEYVRLKTKNPYQQQLVDKYQKLNTLLLIFDYNRQIGSNKSRAYRLTTQANHNTCVYCNRQYTFNIIKGDGSNDDSRIARPALDHWFPKSLFPLLSLSYFNLIPSCTICNSSAKLDKIFLLSDYVHPYLNKNEEPGFKFRFKPALNGNWELYLDSFTSSQEKNTADAFALMECYQCHADLEVKDLLEFVMKNNSVYLKTLFNNILEDDANQMTPKDIYRMVFGTEYDTKLFKNRPLSKLKRDIIEQVNEDSNILSDLNLCVAHI